MNQPDGYSIRQGTYEYVVGQIDNLRIFNEENSRVGRAVCQAPAWTDKGLISEEGRRIRENYQSQIAHKDYWSGYWQASSDLAPFTRQYTPEETKLWEHFLAQEQERNMRHDLGLDIEDEDLRESVQMLNLFGRQIGPYWPNDD